MFSSIQLCYFVQVVDEAFFDLIDPDTGTVANTLQLIKQHNIADWGSDVSLKDYHFYYRVITCRDCDKNYFIYLIFFLIP